MAAAVIGVYSKEQATELVSGRTANVAPVPR
jgi:hypothetical protein